MKQAKKKKPIKEQLGGGEQLKGFHLRPLFPNNGTPRWMLFLTLVTLQHYSQIQSIRDSSPGEKTPGSARLPKASVPPYYNMNRHRFKWTFSKLQKSATHQLCSFQFNPNGLGIFCPSGHLLMDTSTDTSLALIRPSFGPAPIRPKPIREKPLMVSNCSECRVLSQHLRGLPIA